MTLARQVVEQAGQRGVLLTCAESCTGGMVAAALTDIPGSSAVFGYGFVTYSNMAKQDLLAVRGETLAKTGAVSEEVAAEMATGARLRANADLAVSLTGVAGPGASPRKPEGLVCFGLSTAQQIQTERIEFGPLGRGIVRDAATTHALKLLLHAICDL